MSRAIHGATGRPVNFDASFVVSLWFYPLYVAIAALPFIFFRPAAQQRDPLNPYFATSLLLFLYTVSALRVFQQTGLATTVPNVTLSTIGKFALVCLVGQLGLAMGEIAGLLGARHAGRQPGLDRDAGWPAGTGRPAPMAAGQGLGPGTARLHR